MTQPMHGRVRVEPVQSVHQKLQLICKACGQRHTYDVGTIYIWAPEGEADPAAPRGYGFSNYFRCRDCNSAGPWEVKDYFKLMGLMLRAKLGGSDEGVVFTTPALFDGTICQSPALGEEHLLRLIEREPGNAFLCTRLGNLLRGCGRRSQAAEWYGKALALDPGDIEARYHLCRFAMDDDGLPTAVEHVRSLVRDLLKGQKAASEELTRALAVSVMEILRQAPPEVQDDLVNAPPGAILSPEVAFIRTVLEAEGDEEDVVVNDAAERLLAGITEPAPPPPAVTVDVLEYDKDASIDLIPSLRALVEAERWDVRKLAVVSAADEHGRIRIEDRHRVLLSDGKSVAAWAVPSLRELYRGDKAPPSNIDRYPPEYVPFFFPIEKHALAACTVEGDRTDQEMEEIYSALRRRPDGKNHLGPLHDFLWQAAALTLGMHRLSQREFEAIMGQLERSVRKWALRPVSRNYARFLHDQWG